MSKFAPAAKIPLMWQGIHTETCEYPFSLIRTLSRWKISSVNILYKCKTYKPMNSKQKQSRYQRIIKQVEDLIRPVPWPVSRMATMAAILHHKMEGFYWTGFYQLQDGELVAGPYQGPVACLQLEKGSGVCWTSVNKNAPEVVPNVHEFPGHIACSELSNSEIVVPVHDEAGQIRAVIDIDSREFNWFDDTDAEMLQELASMVYKTYA